MLESTEHLKTQDNQTFISALAVNFGLGKSIVESYSKLGGEYASKINQQIGDLALRAVAGEQLNGRIAFEVMERFGGCNLKHGTYKSPKDLTPAGMRSQRARAYPIVEPQQAFWRDGAGVLYKDGVPAICAADEWEYPLLRSVLHRGHVAEFDGLALSDREDAEGYKYFFTSAAFLAAIKERDVSGYVYYLPYQFNQPEYRKKYYSPETNKSWEYRIFQETHAPVWVRTTVEDLPPEIMVIDGEVGWACEFIRELPSHGFMELRNEYEGILDIKQLNGLLPLRMHPNLAR